MVFEGKGIKDFSSPQRKNVIVLSWTGPQPKPQLRPAIKSEEGKDVFMDRRTSPLSAAAVRYHRGPDLRFVPRSCFGNQAL